MSDKYGYIGIESLLNFCSNQKDHCVTPNDFMRMNRIKINDRPRGEWKACEDTSYCNCSKCGNVVMLEETYIFRFCPWCGAPMTEEAFRKYNGLKEGDKK